MSIISELTNGTLLNGNKSTYFDANQLTNKTIGLFFAAYWCRQCQFLTKKLIEAYNAALAKDTHLLFDIIFVSSDNDEESFDEFYQQMPWKAIPFEDHERSEMLLARYHIEDIPSLVILKPDGKVLTSKGDEEYELADAFDFWTQGKTICWTCEPQHENDYIWMNITCHLCHMKPLVGERFGCVNRECGYDLCQACYQQLNEQNRHEHELIHFLSSNNNYTIEELFDGHILINKNNENVTLRSFEGKYLGIFFSALWSISNEPFASNLAQVYAKAIEMSLPFEIVFVSANENQTKFDRHFQSMPWKALTFDNVITKLRLKTYFSVREIPVLIVLKPAGQLLTKSGRRDIENKGIEAVRIWCRGETAEYSSDQYVWSSVVCDGCDMMPLIGQRFYCSTCTNYDLCMACQKNGHEHELTLMEQLDEIE